MHLTVFVGLGNPGSEYDGTRHNVGFMVVEELSRRFKKPFQGGRGNYLLSRANVHGSHVVLIKPLTYMNNSGLAVLEVLDYFDTTIQNIVVVTDDFALPLGALRLRLKGTDGGHNGLYSIIYHLNSDEFSRIRCGIRKEIMPPKPEIADFVLSPFEPEEKKAVQEMVVRAADAAEEVVKSGFGRAMNIFNT